MQRAVTRPETSRSIQRMIALRRQAEEVRAGLQAEYVEEKPDHAFTAREYCKRFNLPGATGQHQIESLLRRGLIARKRVMLPDTGGNCRVLNVYVIRGSGVKACQ